MSEAEFDLLLDAIQKAVASSEQAMLTGSSGTPPLAAANDNRPAWPLIPFPEGWNAAC